MSDCLDLPEVLPLKWAVSEMGDLWSGVDVEINTSNRKLLLAGCAYRDGPLCRFARLLPMVNLHYNVIMHEFSQHGDFESVFAAFCAMKESGIQPDMYSYRSLIDACSHGGDVARAVSVFEVSIATSPSSLIPEFRCFSEF